MRKLNIVALFICYFSSMFFYLFQGGRSSILLFGVFNALLLYLLFCHVVGMGKLEGTRRIGGSDHNDKQYMAGQSIPVSVSIKHRNFIPLPYMKIEDQMTRHDGTVVSYSGTVIPTLKSGVEWKYALSDLKRGVYHFQQMTCTTYDVFGLLEYKRNLMSEDHIQVLPKLLTDVNWEQLLSGKRGLFHLHSQDRYAKESNQQSGIREYVHGDRLSRVHWNATARTGHWKSKDFEKEAMPKGVVILDRYWARETVSSSATEGFEALVSISGSLLHYGMQQQQLFTLISPGSELWSSSNFVGAASYWQAMKHLITVEATSERPLSILLQRALLDIPSGSTLMIVTSDHTREMLTAVTMLKQKGYLPVIFYSRSAAVGKNDQPALIVQPFVAAGIPFYDLTSNIRYEQAAGGEG